MKNHFRLIFLLLIVVVSLGCKSSQNPKNYSDSLIVLPGALNISYDKISETPPAGAGGIFNVTSKLGGLRPSRCIPRQKSGVLCG